MLYCLYAMMFCKDIISGGSVLTIEHFIACILVLQTNIISNRQEATRCVVFGGLQKSLYTRRLA